jgi:hypothetical protein
MSDHSSRLDKITPRLSAFFLACALAGGAAAIMSSAARAGGPDAEAVTIDTTFIVKTPPVRLDKPAHDARASVVLMTGGNGLLSLDMDGNIIDSTGNFLIRSADLVMADVALAYPPPGMSISDRLSSLHAAELQGFINAAMNRWGKPVWVVGSVSAVTAAGFMPVLAGLRGVVLTSTRTVLPSGDQATFDTYISHITVPTLVVWHQNDHCTLSPPAGSSALFASIPSSTKDSESFQGGHSVATDPFGAFSEHGYAGIEEDVVKEIADFIKDTK